MYARVVIRDLRLALGEELRNFGRVSAENNVRMRGALGAAFAAVTAVLLADWMNLDNSYWAGITTLVVSRATYGASLAKGALRVAGTIAGCILAVPLVGLCLDNTFAMLCLIFFMTIFTSVMTFYRGRDSYAWSMAGFIIVLIALAALNISGNVVFHFAVYRAMEISLGSVVAVVMCAIFNPVVSSWKAADKLRDVWTGLADAVRLGAQGWERGKQDAENIKACRQRIKKDLSMLPELIFEGRVEGFLKPGQATMASGLNRLAGQLSRRLFLILDGRPALSRGYAAQFKHELEETAECLDGLGNAMNRILHSAQGADEETEAMRTLAERLKTVTEAMNARHERLTQDPEREERMAEEMMAWSEFRHVLGDFSNALALVFRSDAKGARSEGRQPALERLVIKNGVGLGLTMVLIPVIWNWCDFPGMLQIGVTSIVLLQPDPVVSRRKGILRLTGCVTGGSLGLLLLGTPVPQYLGSWALVYFASIFVFSYLDRGDSRCSYIGLQAGIAMTVTLVQGLGPGVSLEPPLTRLCGILGAFIIWNIVTGLLGGFDPLDDLRRNLDEFYGFLAIILGKTDAGTRASATADAVLRIKASHKDLDVLIWEGGPTPEETAFLQELLARLDRIVIEAKRASRTPETAEARELLAGDWMRLARLREETARRFAEARAKGGSPFPAMRSMLATIDDDFMRDAAHARKWAHETKPSQQALMEVAEALMTLKGMFEAMDWIAKHEPRVREIAMGAMAHSGFDNLEEKADCAAK